MSDQPLHSIRLHGPWQVQILQPTTGADRTATFSCRLPGDWTAPLGPEFTGTVQLQRPFNRPSGLAAGQPVYLLVEMAHFSGQVRLNDQVLGSAGPAEPLRSEISAWLGRRNRITIDVQWPGQRPSAGEASAASQSPSAVRLEIDQSHPIDHSFGKV